jgi:hypothetical protein
MANRLIRYEARLFRRSLADGFRGPADLALLALLAIVGIAWLRDRAMSAHAAPLPPEAIWFAALAGPAGFTLQRLARQRLAWLAEHSPLAPEALEAGGRRTYLGLGHLLSGLLVLAAAMVLGTALGRPVTALTIAATAYALGAGLASVMPAVREGSARGRQVPIAPASGSGARAVVELVLRRQTISRSQAAKRAALLVAGNFALTLAAGWWGAEQPEALRVAAILLPSLAILLLSSRLDPAMLGFLPYAGYRPAFIAAAVSALPAASFAAALLAVLLTGSAANAGALLILALGHLGFILVGIARAWLYPGRLARSVDLQLQLEGAGLLAIAFLLPPLAIAAAGWRLWRFRLHCRALRWAQP